MKIEASSAGNSNNKVGILFTEPLDMRQKNIYHTSYFALQNVK